MIYCLHVRTTQTKRTNQNVEEQKKKKKKYHTHKKQKTRETLSQKPWDVAIFKMYIDRDQSLWVEEWKKVIKDQHVFKNKDLTIQIWRLSDT